MADSEHSRILESGLARYRHQLEEINLQTKNAEADRYYELFEFNSQYSGLFVMMVIGRKWDEENLLGRGFSLMHQESFLIHSLVVQGNYYPAMRELRFLLEFAKRAALLDIELNGSKATEKLEEYRRRESAKRNDFRGGGLLKELDKHLRLTPSEYARIDSLFSSLSSYAHGSSKEVMVVSGGRDPEPSYQKDGFDTCYQFTAGVADLYLFLMADLDMIAKEDFQLPSEFTTLFPLSYPILGS